MAKFFQTTCDACGNVLFGKDKGTYANKSYLQIKGQILLQEFIKEETRWDHTFITPNPNCDITVCDIKCLEAYIKQRKLLWDEKRKEILKKEAEEENTSGSVKRNYTPGGGYDGRGTNYNYRYNNRPGHGDQIEW